MSTIEYRRLFKATVALKVIYKSQSDKAIGGVVFSKNISSLGVNLLMYSKLEKDTQLDLEIHIPEFKQPIKAVGKVVWQEKCPYVSSSKREYYSTGVQFIEMPSEQAIMTSDFIRDLLKKQSEDENKRIIDMIESLGA